MSLLQSFLILYQLTIVQKCQLPLSAHILPLYQIILKLIPNNLRVTKLYIYLLNSLQIYSDEFRVLVGLRLFLLRIIVQFILSIRIYEPIDVFKLYINDASSIKTSPASSLVLFANDIAIVTFASGPNILCSYTNDTLQYIYSYCCKNLHNLNQNKSNVMIFNNKANIDFVELETSPLGI